MRVLSQTAKKLALIFFAAVSAAAANLLLFLFLRFSGQVDQHTPIDEEPLTQIVLSMPWRLNFLPAGLLSTETSFAIYPHIYLTEKEFTALENHEQTEWQTSVIVHERIHLSQQERVHPLREGILYLFSKRYRLQRELEAIKVQMDYLHDQDASFNLAAKARQFASETYGFMLEYPTALDILTHLRETGEILPWARK